MHILAIETSCDDTAAAVVKSTLDEVSVLSSVVSSQIALHAPYGGVVPNLAAREHAENIVPVIEAALRSASLSATDIDLIAVTAGPGLMPALLVGTITAKTLSYLWHVPLIGIHHIEGHIYANFLHNDNQSPPTEYHTLPSRNVFPLLALVVSGGHTQLIRMRDHFQYEILGETQDDAAGECFDKVARLLGLPYPGGPVVAKHADSFRIKNISTQNHAFEFPRPMSHSNDLNFSFSGLKTSVLYFTKKHADELQDEVFIDEVCHEFQEAVVDVLVGKTEQALRAYPAQTFVIAGGVSANTRLRERLSNLIQTHFPDTTFRTPAFQYSLDNAAMIGAAAAFRFTTISEGERQQLTENWRTLDPNASLPLIAQ